MKHLKTYESIEDKIKDKIEIGDYIQVFYPNLNVSYNEEGIQFLNDNIGKVVEISDNSVSILYDVPPNVKSFFPYGDNTKAVYLKYVVGFGKTPEDVKLQMSANKYNL